MMATCMDNSEIIKEGVLHRYEKGQSKIFKQENWKTKHYYAELQKHTATYKSLVCNLYSCKDNKRGAELKDKIEMVSTHQVTKSGSIGVEKHKYDNYICITPSSGSTVFLSFKTKSERDDWHDTIVSALRAMQVPVTGNTIRDDLSHRDRSNTDPQQDLVRKRLTPLQTDKRGESEPIGGAHGFRKVLDEWKAKPTNSQTNEDLTSNHHDHEFNPCCIRNHVVAYHYDGNNMVFHPENFYENVHYVQSETEWHKQITAMRSTVKNHKDIYNDFHQLTVLQTPQPASDEPPKWPSKQRPRQPSVKDSGPCAIPYYPESEPTYMNTRRGGRRSPVESDERDVIQHHSSPHGYINDTIDSDVGLKHSYINQNPAVTFTHPHPNDAPVASFTHPLPPPPESTDTVSKHRARSMRDRPLPPVPKKEDVAKVEIDRRRPSSINTYVPAPVRCGDPAHVKTPPLPPVNGSKLDFYQRLLQDELRQENGITKQFQKSDVVSEKIALVEYNDSLIIAGWEPKHPPLAHTLHIGDKLTMVNQQMLSSASFAQETMKLTAQDEVTLKLQRIPYGQLVTVHKDQPGQTLGIEVKGNEIKLIHPNGLIAKANIRPQTPSVTNTGLFCNYAITEINMRPVGFNATTKQVEEMLRNAGENVSLILHPIDFIQVLKEKMSSKGRRYSFS